MKVFVLVLFSLIFSVHSEDEKPVETKKLETVYPLNKDNYYYGNQGYLGNEENRRYRERDYNKNEGRTSQNYGNNYGYGREDEYTRNNRKNGQYEQENIGYYARDPEGRRFYGNKRNYQYRLIGRVGLGFDKRTANAYSYLAPITPERLELVGTRPFQLNNNGIEVNNTTGAGVMGTVRIFMAPVNDERGRPLSFEEQRRLMIELDKFTQALPAGTSTIRRNSTDSSVTIPYERTFRSQASRPGDPGSATAADFDFCGCGWPHHLLLPKGTTQGYPVVLFCMISNWNEDRVDQDLVGTCNDAASYCGIRDRKYPDRRSMGYPFDRPSQASSLQDFLTPNMSIKPCTIQFNDSTRMRSTR